MKSSKKENDQRHSTLKHRVNLVISKVRADPGLEGVGNGGQGGNKHVRSATLGPSRIIEIIRCANEAGS